MKKLITVLFTILFCFQLRAQNTWTARSIIASPSSGWQGITYGGPAGSEKYVAVASSGTFRVMVSLDAITWIPLFLMGNSNWKSVTYGNGVFVAVASGGEVMTSPDGSTWTDRTSPANNAWQSVTYGNGVFVAVSDAGNSTTDRVMTSPDGINWTLRSIDKNRISVTYGNGKFVALGSGGQIMYSTSNGETWSTTTGGDGTFTSVTYGAGKFVAVASEATSPNRQVITSDDGINWTERTPANSNPWKSVTYGNGQFVAVANMNVTSTDNVMTSPDGITWAGKTGQGGQWKSVTYANGTFVAVGEPGFSSNYVMTSGLTIEPIGNPYYTGSALEPTMVVTSGSTTLTKNTDYTAAYTNNTNPGLATVTITGSGTYSRTGTKTATFYILAKPASSLTIDAIADQTYTGSALTPAPIVKDGGTTLTNGTDYSVAYSNNINAGTATVTITGMGNYTGTKSATFTIVAKATSSLTIDAIADQAYTGSALTPAPVVKDGGTTLTLGADYSVAYSNNTNLGTATVTITGMGNYIGTKTQTFSIAFPTLSIISGNNQTGPVNQMLGAGPILKVLNADGSPAGSISLTATARAGQISRPVLSNLANSYTAGGSTITNVRWKAHQFTTGSTSVTLDQVDLVLNVPDSILISPIVPYSYPKTVQVEAAIYSVVSGLPGVEIGTSGIQYALLPATATWKKLVFNSPIELSPNTSYALVVKSNNAVGFKWGNVRPNLISPNGLVTYLNAKGTDSTNTNWIAAESEINGFSLRGSTPLSNTQTLVTNANGTVGLGSWLLGDRAGTQQLVVTNGSLLGSPLTITATATAVVPSAPTGLSYSPGDRQGTLSFTPGYDGGSAVTNYEYSLDNGITWTALNPADASSPVTITGLTNGVTYPFKIRAVNTAGQGAANEIVVTNDTDGDGVIDTQEATDGTDPIDACSYLVGSQTIANTTAAWKAADCDGDGTPNGTDSGPIDYCVGRVGFTIPKLGTAAYNNFFKNSDCDGDGISNHAECNGADNPDDFDFDGIPNYLDTDSDNDMMSDRDERRIDSDGDGDADYLDLDSDNDGILDKLEGNADADGDGIKNYLDLDSDGDGIKDAWEAFEVYGFHSDYGFTGTVKNADGSFPDVNGNGLADFLETSMGGKPRGPQDTDKDGIPDFLDLDSDGDGIADAVEQTSDMDKDNRPNYRDVDSDGDLIPDIVEKTTDTDGDGSANYLDLDSDADGIADRVEGVVICESCASRDDQPDGMDDRSNGIAVDTDNDGKPDYLDTDSDNDGIPDSVEAGKDPSKPVDTDGDGKPDFRDTDSDNDGIPDSVEAGKDPSKPVDTDGDGKPDYQDTDSDNDGIPDSIEAGQDPSKPVDTDGDGKPDYQDTDSDNDGIPDSVEAGKDPSKPVDTDGDGKPDYQDTDSDNDGIPDSVEAGKDPNKPVDTDGDGKPDYQDTDSDNDGIPDSVEAGKDPNKPVDTDGDGKPDYQDTDSDNDGIPDSVEAGKDPNKPVDTDGDGKPDYQDTDSDNDGIPDAVEAGKDPSKPVDTDGDGKPDYLDTDSDNDGIPDSVEAGKDPQVPVDTDKDGIPDYRDLDSDGDGIPDKIEAGKDPSKPVDTDGDGKPDYQDTDSDNDGIPDAVEAGNVNNPVDTDGDGKPDYQDTDSDGDGIPDKIEAGADPTKPVDTDADGTPDYRDLDSDNDGYADKEEAGKDFSNPVDTDKDGKPDYQDTDSDNDGILDKLENDINYGALTDCDKDGIDNRIDADQCATFAPNGISPNGDGKNDVLIIPGILRNQPNELTIFNRWGNVVYQTSNYKNDWGGQTDRAFSLLAGDNLLPDGTYYYVIDFFGKYPNVGTYVYINRQEK